MDTIPQTAIGLTRLMTATPTFVAVSSFAVTLHAISNHGISLRSWSEGWGWEIRGVTLLFTTHPLLRAGMASLPLHNVTANSQGLKQVVLPFEDGEGMINPIARVFLRGFMNR